MASSAVRSLRSAGDAAGRFAPAPAPAPASDPRSGWFERFESVRRETERRAAFLSDEDQLIQSMPDASPTKWHRAHTTWFFEQFLLQPHAADYRVFDPRFAYLFNSYYVAAGPRHARPQRGMLTRPGNAEIAAYRAHVDAATTRLLNEAEEAQQAPVLRVLEIGLHHEQQHQELLLTDVLHAFSLNPLLPAYDEAWHRPAGEPPAAGFAAIPEGIHAVGHHGEGFCFDNETPSHSVLLPPVRISRSLATNAQWVDFIADGGYATASLWLSDGWATAQAEGWEAPGYWRQVDGVWHSLTLAGLKPVDRNAPVCHVSYYEADAFARWMGKDLPTEQEWEVAARSGLMDDAFGQVWQWTRSAYSPYPGFRAAAGALGEYNGKFMVNQMVLRGSSHATPAGHSRPSYRNFFYPSARWQFSGVRLVDYGA
ncbi:MAG: ergothioneine biosynthesis protein EgtB [Hyphomicrobiales bacterium]|nr:ergothioneine biosynthesis protein EgtB [Hyphomicrobiales bacterium]